MVKRRLMLSYWMNRKCILNSSHSRGHLKHEHGNVFSFNWKPLLTFFLYTLSMVLLSGYEPFVQKEIMTRQFDKPALDWVSSKILACLNNSGDKQAIKNAPPRFTLEANRSLIELKEQLLQSDGHSYRLNMPAKVYRRGVLINQFYWDITLNLTKCSQKNLLEKRTIQLSIRVLNGIGKVDPTSFIIHSISKID